MIDPWKVIDSEVIIDNKWIKLEKKAFLLPNGHIISDYYIVEKPDIVIIVPITQNGQTMVMKEFERGVLEVGLKFPAGRINPGETPEEAAKREFSEETGLIIGKLSFLGTIYADPGWLTTKVYVFIAEDLSESNKSNPELSELFEIEWLPFETLGNLIKEGHVRNIFVISAFHLANDYVNSKKCE